MKTLATINNLIATLKERGVVPSIMYLDKKTHDYFCKDLDNLVGNKYKGISSITSYDGIEVKIHTNPFNSNAIKIEIT